MAITFPSSPTVGDTYSGGARTWSWDGTTWNAVLPNIPSGSVNTTQLVDSAVTSAKIADGAIVDADVNSSAAIAQSKINGLSTSLAAKADLASPTFTGTPAAPTADSNTNTTQIATTAFVTTAISGFSALPSQTGKTGQYLTTDGTTASWAAVSGGASDPVPFFLMGA